MQGAKYFKKRSIQRTFKAEKEALKYQKDIERVYRLAEKQIQGDINQIYKTYAKGAGGDTDKLLEKLSFDETTKVWLKMKQAGNFEYITRNYKSRLNRLESLQADLYSKVHDIRKEEVILQTKSHTETINEAYNRTVFDTQKGVGQPIAFGGLQEQTLDTMLNKNWQGSNYSTRIWANTDRLATTLRDELGASLLTGRSPRRVTSDIQEKFNVAKYVADRLVRTETNYFQNEAEHEANVEMGFDKYVYVAVLDRRTSTICGVTDKLIFKMVDKKTGVNYPPLHPNCRSTTRVYIGKEFEPQTRIAKDENENNITIDNISYEQWNKVYNVQRKVEPTVVPQANAKSKNVTGKQYLGVNKGKEMAPETAVKANPKFGAKSGLYNTNCNKCVPTYELRRRGFNLEALPRDNKSYLFDNNAMIPKVWGAEKMDYRGYEFKNGGIRSKSKVEMAKRLLDYPEGSRIQMTYGYSRRRVGHTIVVERVAKSEKYPKGLIFVDPQVGTVKSGFSTEGKTKFALMRIDDKDIEPGLVDFIAKPKGKK